MNENARVIIRVEYEWEGTIRVCYGEINELKLEQVQAGENNFMLMENDGETLWIDTFSIIHIEVLEVITQLEVKMRMGNTPQAQDAKT